MLIKDIKPDRQSGNLSYDLFYKSENGSGGTRNAIPKDISTLKFIVDEPCLRACEYLFECNIRTVNSSANVNDIGRSGVVTIDYASLDDSNKAVYARLVREGRIPDSDLSEEGGIRAFNISVPITGTTTCEEFSEAMLKIAMEFKQQEILYCCYTVGEMEDYICSRGLGGYTIDGTLLQSVLQEKVNDGEFKVDPVSGGLDISEIVYFVAEQWGYYYDSVGEKFWTDAELCAKALEYKGNTIPNK